MIQIVIVSHGELGNALIQAAEMIAGPAEGVHAVSLLPSESPEGFGQKLEEALTEIKGEETIILIDLFGGTPYNVAARKVLSDQNECITGANLPMLLELVTSREDYSLAELAAMITEAGKDSVKNLGPLLKRKKS